MRMENFLKILGTILFYTWIILVGSVLTLNIIK